LHRGGGVHAECVETRPCVSIVFKTLAAPAEIRQK
jgi:hypothetical protein